MSIFLNDILPCTCKNQFHQDKKIQLNSNKLEALKLIAERNLSIQTLKEIEKNIHENEHKDSLLEAENVFIPNMKMERAEIAKLTETQKKLNEIFNDQIDSNNICIKHVQQSHIV